MAYSVREVQRRLMDRGYSVGKTGADGLIGPATTAAVRAFQEDNNLNIKWPGTIGPLTLAALGLSDIPAPVPSLLPPWIIEGRKFLGLHEVRNNTELKKYLKSDKYALGDPAKLPWCGDYIETIIRNTLPDEPIPENPYWAANWRKFGVPVPKGEYYLGAIGVKARKGGNHVFTIVGHDSRYVHALGGNQSDSVSIVKILKSQITEMRWPKTVPFPSEQMEKTGFTGAISVKES